MHFLAVFFFKVAKTQKLEIFLPEARAEVVLFGEHNIFCQPEKY
jgi:hypothetical protein